MFGIVVNKTKEKLTFIDSSDSQQDGSVFVGKDKKKSRENLRGPGKGSNFASAIGKRGRHRNESRCP